MSDHANSEHSLLSASAAHRWSNCVASLREERLCPDRSSRDADAGTAAHTLGAWALSNNAHPSEYPHKTIRAGARDFPVTAEMVEDVWTYVQAARKDAEGGELLVEQRVVYGPAILGHKPLVFDSVNPDNGAPMKVTVDPADVAWGTSDLIALLYALRHIRIRDYKNGANPNNIVEAEDNEQLYLYLLGALREFELLGDFDTGSVAISQPKLDHAPEHTISIEELRAFAERIGVKARRALELYYRREEPDPEDYAPGEKTCKWCKSVTCQARMRSASTAVALVADVDDFTDLTQIPDMKTVSSYALGAVMDKVGFLEDIIKAVRAEVERRLLADEPVPSPEGGYKIVNGKRGNRAWKDEEAVEAALKSMRLRQEQMYTFKLKGPKPLEDLLAKANPKRWSKLVKLYHQPEGKPSVAPMRDPRPAITKTAVLEGFDDLGEDLV
jgi:hypothetical protein